MRTNSPFAAAFAAAAFFFSASAFADVAPDPCEGADVGDACEDLSGDAGVCADAGTYMFCDTETGTGGAGQGGSNVGGDASGGSSAGGSDAGGSDAGGSGSTPDSGNGSEDDSCAVSAVGASGSAEAAGLLALLGACFAFRNRRQRRF